LLTTIIKNTFTSLNRQGLKATPDEYKRVFCTEAKNLGIYAYEENEENLFRNLLSQSNAVRIKNLNINNMDDLLDYIEDSFDNFMSSEDLRGLIGIVRDALHPSLGVVINDEIDSFNKDITKNPQLLINKEVQYKIHKLFELRCDLDKNTMSSRTKQLVKMLSSVTQEFTKTISATNNSNDKILEIKKNIENLDTSVIDDKEVSKIKEDMMTIAQTFEKETTKLTNVLEKYSEAISKMTKRIQHLEKSLKDAKQDSITDFMTGTKTRRGFDQYIEQLDSEYKNNNKDYCAVFFDIDHFKIVNDTYGHDAGDTILITFAKLLKKEVGNAGEVFRFGGEEFVSIFPGISIKESASIAEKIRKMVERSKFIHEDLRLNITFSAGVAQRSSSNCVDELINSADALLYRAKQSGRNKVLF